MHKHWVWKMPRWVRIGVSMIEKDSDIKLVANNQGIEGLVNNEKNLVTRMKTYPIGASYIHVVSLQESV